MRSGGNDEQRLFAIGSEWCCVRAISHSGVNTQNGCCA